MRRSEYVRTCAKSRADERDNSSTNNGTKQKYYGSDENNTLSLISLGSNGAVRADGNLLGKPKMWK